MEETLSKAGNIAMVAVDEAHCISEWWVATYRLSLSVCTPARQCKTYCGSVRVCLTIRGESSGQHLRTLVDFGH